MIDFEEQWKEEFMRNYLDSIKKDKGVGKKPKANISILEALKGKIWK